MPPEALDLALWLEADRMGGLLDRLVQGNVNNQRDAVKNERRQRVENLPYGMSFECIVESLFPETRPYRHTAFGSMADLDAASLADVYAFFTQFYASSNACLSLVGKLGPNVLSRVVYFFGGIAACAQVITPADTRRSRHCRNRCVSMSRTRSRRRQLSGGACRSRRREFLRRP